MDIRGLLSHNSTRCILVFFENTILQFNSNPSEERRQWFENFREYLDVNPLGYANSKESGSYTEEIIFVNMKFLDKKIKTWIIESALEMIFSDENLDLSDVRITAERISKALDIPLNDFYDIMDSQTAEFRAKTEIQNRNMEPDKRIYYSKYKTTGLLYSQGEFVFSLYPNDTVSLTTADFKLHYYDIESLYEDRNDRVFIIRSHDSNMIGEFRLKPMGKAELSFSGKTILKLKI